MKKELINAMENEDQGDLLPLKMRSIRRMLLGVIFSTTAVVGVFLLLVPIDEKVNAIGKIRAERDLYVYANRDGILAKTLVHEGDHVVLGDPVVQMDDTNLQDQLKKLEARLEKSKSDLEVQKLNLNRISRNPLPKEFWHLQEEWGGAREKVKKAEENQRRDRDLFEKGLLSKYEMEQSDLNLYLAKSEEDKVQEKLRIVEGGLEQSILDQAKAEIRASYAIVMTLETEKKIILSEIERSVIRAPESGVVTLIQKRRTGERVEAGEDLLHLAIGENNRVEIFVQQNQYHRLKVGQKVVMKSKTFDSFRFGYIEGEVVQLALEPEKRNVEENKGEIYQEPLYRLYAHVKSTPQKLTLGSSVEVRIIIHRVPLWRYFFR